MIRKVLKTQIEFLTPFNDLVPAAEHRRFASGTEEHYLGAVAH